MIQDLQQDLLEVVKLALYEFYKNDMNELLRGDRIQNAVSERSMVFRIGIYLENIIKSHEEFKNYNLDSEYNRNNLKPKKIYDKNTYPDLIIHKRRSNDSNLLVIEFKKGEPRKIDYDEDINKLKNYTKTDYTYKFKFGFYIELHNSKCKIEIYSDGKLLDKIEEIY